MKAFRLAFLPLCLSLIGCAMGHEIVKVRTVKVAILPEYSLQLISKKYDPLLRYLSEETGYRLELVSPMDYRSFLSTVEGSGAEISLQNALLLTRLEKTKGAYPIAAGLGTDGSLTQRGIIVVRRDRGIDKLADLKGKVVMIPAREAVLGYLAQGVLLRQNGVDVEKDMTLVSGVRHDQVLTDVWHGRADAGFVKERALAEAAGRVNLDDLKTLERTEAFPGWCFAAFPESDTKIVRKIKNALLDLRWQNPAERPILEAAGFRGFVEPSQMDLTPIHQAIDSLALPY